MGWYRGSPEATWIALLAATAAAWDLQQGGVLLAPIQLYVLWLFILPKPLCRLGEVVSFALVSPVHRFSFCFSLTHRSLGQLHNSTALVT